MRELHLRGNRIEYNEVFQKAEHPNDRITTIGSCEIEANQFAMFSQTAKELICELIGSCLEQQAYRQQALYRADAERAVKEIKLLLQAVEQ